MEDNLNIMKMEDNLNFFENGRQLPFFFKIPYFYIFSLQKNDDLNILKNGRRSQKGIYIYNQLHSTAHTSNQPVQQNKLK
jgi:hypothetical protein